MTIDISRPHIGRIYDYVLGGTQNYEADRIAAEAMMAIIPAYPRWARINRSFLGHVGKRWAAEGMKQVLDLGSGLPTQGHFNERLPEAKILFSDFDPLTVAQAQQLLAYTPDMAYANIDLRDPDALIAQAAEFFGANRALAVGGIGVMYFLTDDEIRSLMKRLHDYCAPGTVMALSFHHMPVGTDPGMIERVIDEGRKHARINFFLRTAEHMAELIAPWRLTVSKPIQDWLDEEERALLPPVLSAEGPFAPLILVGAFAER
jgi:O-methyltransferase involved in polyketide biosynthesis